MAQGTTQPRVKVINPKDIQDADARDILAQILTQVSIANVLLVKIAEAVSGDDVIDLDTVDVDA